MRVTQAQEWVVVAALVAYIAFTPGFQVVRSFLSTPVGKALGLAVIVYVWKYVSCLIALLLTISFLRCAGGSMREGLGTCPPGTVAKSDMPGKCSKMVNGVEQLVDEVPATAPPSDTPTPPPTTPPMTTPAPPTAAPLTIPSAPPMPPATEGFTPNMKETKMGGVSFSPF